MSGVYTAVAAAVASAAGAGLSSYNQNQTMRKQDSQLAASIRNQGALNSRATNDVSQLNSKIAASNPNDAVKQQTAAYLGALGQAAPVQSQATPSVAGGSKRYAQAQSDAKQNVADYARATASNSAKAVAPALQRIGEGQSIASTASDLGLLNDTSQAEQGILKTQLAGDSANPWVSSVANLLSGAGSGLSTYAGTKRAGSSNPYLGG